MHASKNIFTLKYSAYQFSVLNQKKDSDNIYVSYNSCFKISSFGIGLVYLPTNNTNPELLDLIKNKKGWFTSNE